MSNVKYLITKEDAIKADEELNKIAERAYYGDELVDYDFGFLLAFMDMIKANAIGDQAQFAEIYYGKEIETTDEEN